MKVVVSVGGSVLVPDMRPERVQQYADVIEELVEAGYQVGAVVGGGRAARDYISTARELGANEIELDQMGIAVTRLNARLLLAALPEDLAAPTIPSDYEEAGEALHHSDVTVMGGVQPGQTTDAVSAALAEYVDADLLVYATSVPGVYDADPNEVADAERFDSMRAGELVEVIASMEMAAGSNAPVDLLAAKLIQRAGMHAVVLDGSEPSRVARAVLDDEYDGTEIVPDYR
jgi:uridylate kinase